MDKIYQLLNLDSSLSALGGDAYLFIGLLAAFGAVVLLFSIVFLPISRPDFLPPIVITAALAMVATALFVLVPWKGKPAQAQEKIDKIKALLPVPAAGATSEPIPEADELELLEDEEARATETPEEISEDEIPNADELLQME